MAVTAFASERDLAVFLVELSAECNQLTNSIACFPHDGVDDFVIAEALAGSDRVGRVAGDIVEWIQHARDSALSPRAVG